MEWLEIEWNGMVQIYHSILFESLMRKQREISNPQFGEYENLEDMGGME